MNNQEWLMQQAVEIHGMIPPTNEEYKKFDPATILLIIEAAIALYKCFRKYTAEEIHTSLKAPNFVQRLKLRAAIVKTTGVSEAWTNGSAIFKAVVDKAASTTIDDVNKLIAIAAGIPIVDDYAWHPKDGE